MKRAAGSGNPALAAEWAAAGQLTFRRRPDWIELPLYFAGVLFGGLALATFSEHRIGSIIGLAMSAIFVVLFFRELWLFRTVIVLTREHFRERRAGLFGGSSETVVPWNRVNAIEWSECHVVLRSVRASPAA